MGAVTSPGTAAVQYCWRRLAVSEWLKIMLEEIRRKNDQRREDVEEHQRRVAKARDKVRGEPAKKPRKKGGGRGR